MTRFVPKILWLLFLPIAGCDTFKAFALIDSRTGRQAICATGLNQEVTPEVQKAFDACIATCESFGYIPESKWAKWTGPMSLYADKICKPLRK
jgi:hypothetical protein